MGTDGKKRLVTEGGVFIPAPYEVVVKVSPKLILEKDQYVKLTDESTGIERVERGPKTFVPRPMEVYPGGVQKAKFLDTDTAILVLNKMTGQERLVTQKSVFVPKPVEEILETRKLIRVDPNEAVVTRDAQGGITVNTGSHN